MNTYSTPIISRWTPSHLQPESPQAEITRQIKPRQVGRGVSHGHRPRALNSSLILFLLSATPSAAISKPRVDEVIEGIKNRTQCRTIIPKTIKPIARVIERVMLRHEEDLSHIADMVTYN